MLRSRQRSLWLLGIAVVWIVGVYMVYQKATSVNLLNTWPQAAVHVVQAGSQEKLQVDKVLNHIQELENVEAANNAKYREINKKVLYFIDRKFRSQKKEEKEKAAKRAVRGKFQPGAKPSMYQ